MWCCRDLGAGPLTKRWVSNAALGGNVVPGESQCWGPWCDAREGDSAVLDPVRRVGGSSGLGAWCGAEGQWWGCRALP